MKQSQDLGDVLVDLLKINNDRIGIYQKAIKEIDEHNLRKVFWNAVEESRRVEFGLIPEIFRTNSVPDLDAKTTAGQLYMIWLDIKTFFSGSDYTTLLRACEFAEFSIQKAYREALKRDDISLELSRILRNQATALRNFHIKMIPSFNSVNERT